jgi:adenylate cyclase
MGREIERKYLVRTDGAWRRDADDGERIVQGYLSLDPDRTVRVRLRAGRAVITVKGRNDGPTRAEFEYEVPYGDGEQLLDLCIDPVIEKVRHLAQFEGRTWEIDQFYGANAGLVLAEVELDDADVVPVPPAWVESDVTDDPRYYNANLVQQPQPRE